MWAPESWMDYLDTGEVLANTDLDSIKVSLSSAHEKWGRTRSAVSVFSFSAVKPTKSFVGHQQIYFSFFHTGQVRVIHRVIGVQSFSGVAAGTVVCKDGLFLPTHLA